jgi:hypothetical protein
MQIKDILTIDLEEDIKNVIDLEDLSEQEIKSEIEGYIVTDGLAKEYADFVDIYTSNIKETGVWISGFYGSGKSYFGKLLGYMMSNQKIAGTYARERILQRFSGIENEALTKNAINKLDSINSRVIFLDIAKQDTTKGLAYTLFKNFLKSLDLPENEHGYLLYQMLVTEGKTDVHNFIFENAGTDWSEIKSKVIRYSKVIKEIYLNKGNNENDYQTLFTTVIRGIEQFSAGKLKEELKQYLDIVKDENIVFLFDEASEALNQQKYNLLDLEGISEALSSLSRKVWTIAIAQERLDDVINNSNVSKAQLTKVTDRFKTKIHLEATEVDVIIRSRLLKKSKEGLEMLAKHYKANTGKIIEHSSLIGTGMSKTDTESSYLTYYPFYKYQFDLLQNFLFGTKGYASTKVAARGMIITTYEILKLEIQKKDLFHVATGWQIGKEGQPQPPVRLVNRYTNSERILKESGSTILGRRLLETINFLHESEVVPTTVQNIIKAFTADPEESIKQKDHIIKALEILTESKILLETNRTYRITSDIEQRLLDEMMGYTVQGYMKKKKLNSAYKSSHLLRSIAKITDSNQQYEFYITTDNDEELTTPSLKNLKTKVKSIYNFGDDRQSDLESLKQHHKDDKDLIWIVPENNAFKEIDRLIDEIERINFLEQKYTNPNSDEGKILAGFTSSREDKQTRLNNLIENSLAEGTVVYLFNLYQLSTHNWQHTLTDIQKQVIQNIYTKRLASQLSDSIAVSVIKEPRVENLKRHFSGEDFKFFDASGNFIGENLKVAEEILYKLRNTFVDGLTLEKDLEVHPTGYAFGTVISTVAALMRGNKVIAKYNGKEKFSFKDDGVLQIFSSAKEFRKSSFKKVSKSLSAVQKQELVQFLLDIEADHYIDTHINYNTNDFELINAIRDLGRAFVEKVTQMKNLVKSFDELFPDVETDKDFLGQFTGAITESNYIDRCLKFLENKSKYQTAIQHIEKIESFVKTKLPKAEQWKAFTTGVKEELHKAAKSNPAIEEQAKQFEEAYKNKLVKEYSTLQQITQKIKDEYHKLFQSAAEECTGRYQPVLELAQSVFDKINTLPAGLNRDSLYKVSQMISFAEQRLLGEIELENDVKDRKSKFTYSEVLSFIELANSKKTQLEILSAELKTEEPIPLSAYDAPEVTEKPKRKYNSKLPSKKLRVIEYKSWLQKELYKVSDADDEDEIELED